MAHPVPTERLPVAMARMVSRARMEPQAAPAEPEVLEALVMPVELERQAVTAV
jgi:hypothetical protein